MDIYNYLTPKDKTYFMSTNTTLRQAIEIFDKYRFNCVPIIDDEGKYITTITEGDILRHLKNKCNFSLPSTKVIKISEIEKHRPYKELDVFSNEKDIFDLSLDQSFIPVVDGRGVFIGILRRKEIIKYLYDFYMEKSRLI